MLLLNRAMLCLMVLMAYNDLATSSLFRIKLRDVNLRPPMHTCSSHAQLQAPETQQPVSKKHRRHTIDAIVQPAPSLQPASLPAQILPGLTARQHSTEAAAADGTPRERKKKRKHGSEQGLQPAGLLSTPGMSAEAKAELGVSENGPSVAAMDAAAPALVKTEPGSLDGKLSKKQKRKLELSTPGTGSAVPKQEPSPGSETQFPSAELGSKMHKSSKKQREKPGLSSPDLIGMDAAMTPRQELGADSAAGTRPAGVLESGSAKLPKKKSRLGMSTSELSGIKPTATPKQEPALGSTAAAEVLGGKRAKPLRKETKGSVDFPDSSLPAGTSSSMPLGLKLGVFEDSPSSVKAEAASLLAGNGAAVKSEEGVRKAKKKDRISDTEHRTAEHTLPNGHCQPQQHAHLSDGTSLPASSSKQHKRSSKKTSHATDIQ